MQSNIQNIAILSPTLPTGGGAISGMGEALAPAGPDGMVNFTVPLPISAGRGFAPELALSYNSASGNSPFGMGWQCFPPTIQRSTQEGTPDYSAVDTFLSPNGERLLRVEESLNTTPSSDFGQIKRLAAGNDYNVTRYQPQVIQQFSLFEHWQSKSEKEAEDFWIVKSPDGNISIFGKNSQARIANPSRSEQIAQWLLEETLSPLGEHIYYQYLTENDSGCDSNELAAHPTCYAQRYLSTVYYGNKDAKEDFFVFDDLSPEQQTWLFKLDFYYNDSVDSQRDKSANWDLREDCFSDYKYGFEVRTRRLCRRISIFHNVSLLEGKTASSFELIHSLNLSYQVSKAVTTLTSVWKISSATAEEKNEPSLPPIEFSYTSFSKGAESNWQMLSGLKNFNHLQSYQLIDLMGEGIAGVLYLDENAWWYSEPTRDESTENINAVVYTNSQKLPASPSLYNNSVLQDIDSDGQLEWLVTTPTVQGYYTLNRQKEWNKFIPFNAFPNEYYHPSAQFADICGKGLLDLVMIGPKSVRFYPKSDLGWGQLQEVFQEEGITLPVFGRDERQLTAFSDMLGSGQQHLVRITAEQVTCWPNLGKGRFGKGIMIPGFKVDADTFDPKRILLADTDGSGTTDLLYIFSDRIDIFLNQSGNSFATPISIDFPDSVRFDNTCFIQAADIQGLGISSIILTIPHISPQHWCCHLSDYKPWLLEKTNNNKGAETRFFYRSSAQNWLDEKKQAALENRKVISGLPFPIHTLWRTETEDEISRSLLVSLSRFYGGLWDNKERQFRGFSYLEKLDSEINLLNTTANATPPVLVKSWYLTGDKEWDDKLADGFWLEDKQAWPLRKIRYTQYNNNANKDDEYDIQDTENQYWLDKALQGQPLRMETYALDQSSQEKTPYEILQMRYQVRRIPSSNDKLPSALLTPLETTHYRYERIVNDPACTQNIILSSDRWGTVTESIDIIYPRRDNLAADSYPTTFPSGVLENSVDDQQNAIFINRSRNSWFHLTDESWILGLDEHRRVDTFTAPRSQLPTDGFYAEYFLSAYTSWHKAYSRTFATQQSTYYTAQDGEKPLAQPNRQALVAFEEKSAFDDATLAQLKTQLSTEQLNETLTKGGYILVNEVLGDEESGSKLWMARTNYRYYGNAEQFYRLQASRRSLLSGKTQVTWDTTSFAPLAITTADGGKTQLAYDYRFLTPYQLIDANDNTHHLEFDALGRVTSRRFWGTENGAKTGYSTLTEKPFIAPETIEKALALPAGQPVANFYLYFPDSWRNISALYQSITGEPLSPDKGILHLKLLLKRLAQTSPVQYSEFQSQLENVQRLPPHTLQTVTDRYDNDSAQKLRHTIIFSDGFGRALQTSVLTDPGDALSRNIDGSLAVAEINPTDSSNDRWIVSGRIEYDNKGNVIRSYLPYFLNDWKWVANDSNRTDAYSDLHIYDALGREIEVWTAAGFMKRTQYYPWFSIFEDENDTASSIASRVDH